MRPYIFTLGNTLVTSPHTNHGPLRTGCFMWIKSVSKCLALDIHGDKLPGFTKTENNNWAGYCMFQCSINFTHKKCGFTPSFSHLLQSLRPVRSHRTLDVAHRAPSRATKKSRWAGGNLRGTTQKGENVTRTDAMRFLDIPKTISLLCFGSRFCFANRFCWWIAGVIW